MKAIWLGKVGGWLWPVRILFVLTLLTLLGGHARLPFASQTDPGLAANDAMADGLTASASMPSSRMLSSRNRGLATADDEAARFLTQATFGPRLEDIDHVRQIGITQWLDEQFAMPASYELAYLDAMGATEVEDYGQLARMEAWFLHALGGPDPFQPTFIHRDQLRQRVAFALSEIFVVSDRNGTLWGQPYALAGYYDVLVGNAFGNFRQLLEEVTLHPSMGVYLSVLGNQKPDPEQNIRPDENYAREALQLFSIGLVQLNQDGTPILQSGQPVPTYDQFTVKGFAHVFTGWTFAGCEPGTFPWCWEYDMAAPAWRTSMQAHPDYHASEGTKQLLVYPGVALPGGVLPAGGTPASDLDAALDNIFNHPNVAPFIGKQLIQRLVTSNPSPAYVARVSAVFNNNGQGVRGDLGAVVKAILLDPEARSATLANDPGKVREPILRLTHVWRALDARTQTGRMSEYWPEYYLGQAPLRAPSVFNFFSPDYSPSGELTMRRMLAPELQLATDNMMARTHNALGDEVFWYYIGNPDVGPDDICVDLARDSALAGNPTALVDRYNTLFLSGQMSTSMRNIMIDYLTGIPNDNGGRDRVQEALYLIINSSEYTVQK